MQVAHQSVLGDRQVLQREIAGVGHQRRELVLDRLDLAQAADVPLLAGELGGQEGADHLARQRRADHARAQAQHVHVVVLDALVPRVGVVRAGGADARELAARHGHARARAADHHGPLGAALADRVGARARRVGVVDGVGGVRAEVDRLVAGLADHLEHDLLEREPGVVERARDPHRPSTASSITWPVSAAYSCAAIRAAPSTPARGPWCASRMSHMRPGARARRTSRRSRAPGRAGTRRPPTRRRRSRPRAGRTS